ncbi:MAG: TetR/AcrR family transcriptional regulator [Granulosicoccaceae bacterium]
MPRPATFSRTEVIERAKSVFCKKGYSKTSMQDLVKTTGLHPGSLYGAFNNKETLFNECIKSDLKVLFEVLEDTFEKHESAHAGLEAYFLKHWNDSLHSTQDADLRFIFRASLDVDEELTESWRLLSEAVEQRNAIIVKKIEQAQADGDIRDDYLATEINSFLAMGSLGLRCMQQHYQDTPPKHRCIDIMLDFIKPRN